MSTRPISCLAAACALALALLGTVSGGAGAAQTTLEPSPAEARTFAASAGGWSSAVDYGGLVCIPGLTCPSASSSHEGADGAGGAGDGHLRTSFGTLLGVLSTTTVTWRSPAFAAPATPVDAATLDVAVRPQVASLLTIGSVAVRMRLLDETDARATVVASVPVTRASSAFGTLSAAVPPGTVVAGHSYRVAIDVALTTTVSAVTSGDVDIDDVVLRLVDLEPPSGLGAAFASGPARVDGSVDPAGQTTTVTVEYGPTAAYGSATAPAVVSGSGAQPFSVPLAGLAAGATYHYRVVAQNADGSTATSDATFVAPTPPGDAPPIVTGAGNSRDRTAVFDRDGTIVAAAVELLEAGTATVLASFDDLDGDGVVAIRLPDQDGDYDVRVVRENDVALVTTSAPVTASLDRVPPAVGGVALTVTPAVSADAQRSVTFTPPADAISASAQVLDGDDRPVGAPVAAVGGSATVQLGVADGDYRVQLTLLDAAGNAATADSGIVTLDQTAPTAGGAPVVTGAGNRRERSVAFDRDLTALSAAIEVLDGDGRLVASAGVPPLASSGTVTLPDADGDYTVRVRQTDLAGNAATTAGTPVTLDRVPPTAGPAPTVVGAGSSRERVVSFQRAPDAASATVELLDARGAVVDAVAVPSGSEATVQLPDQDGAYGVRVVQQDAAGNAAGSPAATAVLDRVAPDAGDAPAVSGPADALVVTFRRAPDAVAAQVVVRDAGGAVVASANVPSGDSGTVDLPDVAGDYMVTVVQTDIAGNAATSPATVVTRADSGSSGGDGSGGGADGGSGSGGSGSGGDDGSGSGSGSGGSGSGRDGSGSAGGGSGAGGAGGGTGSGSGSTGGQPGTISDPGRYGQVLRRCFGGDVVLIDAIARGARVRVHGVTRFAPGTVVRILTASGRRVGRARASRTGRFTAVVRAPRAARARLRAGYRAAVGRQRSPVVKVRRANRLQRLALRGHTLVLRGRVDRARLGRVRRIVALGGAGASACRRAQRLRTVGRVRVNRRTGAYRLRVRAPRGSGRVVVRTRVFGTKLTSRSAYLIG